MRTVTFATSVVYNVYGNLGYDLVTISSKSIFLNPEYFPKKLFFINLGAVGGWWNHSVGKSIPTKSENPNPSTHMKSGTIAGVWHPSIPTEK